MYCMYVRVAVPSELRTEESCAAIGKYFRGRWCPPIRLTPSCQPEVTAAGITLAKMWFCTNTTASEVFWVLRADICRTSQPGNKKRARRSSVRIFKVSCGGCWTGQRSIDCGASDKTSCSLIFLDSCRVFSYFMFPVMRVKQAGMNMLVNNV